MHRGGSVIVRRHAAALAAALLASGCFTSSHPPAPPPESGTGTSPSGTGAARRDAAASPQDAGDPSVSDPGTGATCGDAVVPGRLLFSQREVPYAFAYDVYEGCDDAPIVLHQPGLPPYTPELQEQYRAWLADVSSLPVALGPCCPSQGEASGTCVIWPTDDWERTAFAAGDYQGFVIDMWLVGASATTDGGNYPNCIAIRRPL